jgi:protein SCO1/2
MVKAKEGALLGKDLYNSRCASCHSFGEGDSLGPDLLGIASKRDQDWLARWIREPDVMIKAKDPLALALYEKYNRLPMPNIRLTDEQARAIILYMEETTRRIMKERSEKVEVVDQADNHSDHHSHAH